MKKLLFILLLMSSYCSFSQDLIVLKNGTTINCKIINQDYTNVSYTLPADSLPQTHVISYSDVQSLFYGNMATAQIGVKTIYTAGDYLSVSGAKFKTYMTMNLLSGVAAAAIGLLVPNENGLYIGGSVALLMQIIGIVNFYIAGNNLVYGGAVLNSSKK